MLHTNSFDFGNLQVLHIIFSFLLLDNEGILRYLHINSEPVRLVMILQSSF